MPIIKRKAVPILYDLENWWSFYFAISQTNLADANGILLNWLILICCRSWWSLSKLFTEMGGFQENGLYYIYIYSIWYLYIYTYTYIFCFSHRVVGQVSCDLGLLVNPAHMLANFKWHGRTKSTNHGIVGNSTCYHIRSEYCMDMRSYRSVFWVL